MTPELKEKWAAALESGEYKQAKGLLRDLDDRMCCLGVLCQIVDPSEWDLPFASVEWRFSAQAGMPGLTMLHEVGLSIDDAMGLAEANDGGETFTQIAERVRGLPVTA